MKRPAPALRTAQAVERLQEEVQVSLLMKPQPSARRRLPITVKSSGLPHCIRVVMADRGAQATPGNTHSNSISKPKSGTTALRVPIFKIWMKVELFANHHPGRAWCRLWSMSASTATSCSTTGCAWRARMRRCSCWSIWRCARQHTVTWSLSNPVWQTHLLPWLRSQSLTHSAYHSASLSGLSTHHPPS